MTMKTVTENGTVYHIDDNGMVRTTSVENEATTEVPDLEFTAEPLRIGDRIEAEGKLGKVATRSPSVYGDSIGVKFDDGTFEEYLASDLERTAEDEIVYDKPIDEVRADWTTYQTLPEYTLEDVDNKAAIARRLNVTAKALITDSRTPLGDRIDLDHIVLVTGTDLYDLREKAERITVDDHSDYLESLPKYEMDSEFQPYTSRSKEDVSWLMAMAEDATEELGNIDWTQHLTDEALKATARLTAEQLENDQFMQAVAGYREDAMPMGFDDGKRSEFKTLLEEARQVALNERKAQRVAKTAAVEDDLADFDASALFLQENR